jgi:protease IV
MEKIKGNNNLILIFLAIIFSIGCSKPPEDKNKKPDKKIVKTSQKSKNTLSKATPVAKPAVTPKKASTKIKKKELAFIRLSGVIGENAGNSPFKTKTVPLNKVLRILRKLGDLKADTLFIYLSGLEASYSSRWEIRELLVKIKKKKKIVIFADSLDTKSYFLASVGNKIYLNPAGGWEVSGIAMESFFVKDFLEMFGISADFLRMGKFKGAAENLTRSSMSKELRESLETMISTFFNTMVDAMVVSRKVKKDLILKLIDKAPISAEEALKEKLIDGILPFDVAFEKYSKNKIVRKPKKKKKKKTSIFALLSPSNKEETIDTTHIALIFAEGSIHYGFNDPNDIFSKDQQIRSHSFIKTIKEVADNSKVSAVVIRVNSPGGSALASEIIWRAIHNLKLKKPVIVSMGAYGASGGYYIASAASKILVSPFTLTGSIGVVGGKIVFEKAMNKYHIKSEIIKRGKNAAWNRTSARFTPGERVAIAASMERIYKLFKKRIIQGRPKTKNLEEVAQGRVWSGLDAFKIGLVDKIGGMRDAATLAKKMAALPLDSPVVIYPRPKPWLATISELLEEGPAVDEVIYGKFIESIPFIKNHTKFINLFKNEQVIITLPFVLDGI